MIEFRADKPIWTDALDLYAREEREGKVYAFTCDGIRKEEAKPGGLWPKFFSFTLMDDGGQSLFDALWNVGYRPHKGESSTAHVEALKYHLEDMRQLVFAKPKK